VIRRLVRFVDERTGQAPVVHKLLRYVFPDHWSFLLGEIALYCFVILVATGIYLTLFFEPSLAQTTYRGTYEPLRGVTVSEAYRSTLDISFQVKAGLLLRQTHHWAADVFLVAITLHVLRVFFTGAFRKPRDLIYYLGVALVMLAVLEGFLGYSLVDDLMSGMGLAIAYSVVMSIPVIGGNLALAIWGAPFPGAEEFTQRMYILHVLLIPVTIGLLIAAHLGLLVLRHHTQFPGPRATEKRAVGVPLWPGYVPRTLGVLFGTAAVLFLLGGLVQINPIWEWGPFETGLSTNGAQPDWYLGWLIGALRIVPGFDVAIGDVTLIPNAFWGGAFFPLVVFAFLFLWPTIERRVTGDDAWHNLLDRPRDNPWRTGVGAGFFTWVALVFFAGSADRVFVQVGIPYTWQIWVFRVAFFVLPLVVGRVAYVVARELAASELHPLRDSVPTVVRRTPAGGFQPEEIRRGSE
jgi:ubiquinol-cytochrome c reductase cytochrome b subunit